MKQKVLSMFLATLIATSIMGVTFAHWSDYVTVEGYAEMGSLTFGFTRIVAEWDSEVYEGYPPEKDTGEGVCVLSIPEEDEHTLMTVYKLLTFTITDAYPQYWAINKFTLDNAGTIPLCIHSVVLTVDPGFSFVEDPAYPGAKFFVYDDRALLVYEIWLYKEPEDYGAGWEIDPPWMFPGPYGDIYGVRQLYSNQIDPGEELLTEICVYFYQDAEQCHTYEFSIEIEGIQWNKHP